MNSMWQLAVQKMTELYQTGLAPLFLIKNLIESLLLLLCGGGAAYRYLKKKLHTSEAKILGLESDNAKLVEERNALLDQLRKERREQEVLRADLPTHALQRIQKSATDRLKIFAEVRDWFTKYGISLSELLTWRALYCMSHAAGEIRLEAWSFARAYATASLALNPVSADAESIAVQIDFALGKSGEHLVSLKDGYESIDERLLNYFYRSDQVTRARAILTASEKYGRDGLHKYALLLAETAYEILCHMEGPRHRYSLAARMRVAAEMACLGHYPEAAATANEVSNLCDGNPQIDKADAIRVEASILKGMIDIRQPNSRIQMVFIPDDIPESQHREIMTKSQGTAISGEDISKPVSNAENIHNDQENL